MKALTPLALLIWCALSGAAATKAAQQDLNMEPPSTAAAETRAQGAMATKAGSATMANYPKLPLSFERRGDEQFVARGDGYLVDVRGRTAIITSRTRPRIGMEFVSGRDVAAQAEMELPGKVNYLIGNDPKKWRVGMPTYERVRYQSIYPGVDVVYYGNQRQLEFDLVLQPGAAVKSIRMRFSGAEAPRVGKDGSLELGQLRLLVPKVTQERREIAARYLLLEGGEVGFEVGEYDPRKRLTIDPVLSYSTLMGGGSNSSFGRAIALDAAGCAYIAGYTSADDYPAVAPAFAGHNAGADGFISKLNPTGSALLYSTYIGGSSSDGLFGIAVDSAGAVWAVGTSYSADFPLLTPYQSNNRGSGDAVVLKLNSSGGLVYSTFLGQTGYDEAKAVAVDASGNAYVTGQTAAGFPTTAGVYQPVFVGGTAAFVTKFGSSGTLLWSTFLGGGTYDIGYSIAVDAFGNSYIAGISYSTQLPNVPPGSAQPTNKGGGDAFVAKLNFNGSGLLYYTFLGGSDNDYAMALAVEANSGIAVVAGRTMSSDLMTSAGAAQATFGGASDGFVAKVNAAGTTFQYVTYLGGKRVDQVIGVALDTAGNAYVTGGTESRDFPTVSAIQVGPQGNATSLFRSVDAGANWSALDNNLPGNALSISADPTVADALLVSTSNGIFRSMDAGASWTRVSTLANYYLARSPANPAVLYAYSCSVYLSTDNGATWSNRGNPGRCGRGILADPLNPNVVYVYGNSYGTTPGGTVVVSTDYGASWSSASNGIPSTQIADRMTATSNGNLFAALRSNAPGVDALGVYRSNDHGENWVPVNTGIPSNFPLGDIASGPGNTVYLTDFFTLYRTTNAGASWTVAGQLPTAFLGCIANQLGVSMGNPSIVYWAPCFFGWGISPVAVSRNGGGTWEAGSGLGPATVSTIVGDPRNSAVAYALTTLIENAFVAKLDPTGKSLLYSTYLGDSGAAYAIATSASGDAYVTGDTNSRAFPISAAALKGVTSLNPQKEVFVTRISGNPGACGLLVNPNTYISGPYESAVQFSVVGASGCSWTAASDQSWAKILTGASGSGTGVVYVLLSPSDTNVPRTATLSIAGQSVVLTQLPSGCYPSFTTGSSTVPNTGGSLTLNVATGTGCPWNVLNNHPNAIRVTGGASGTGNGVVTLEVGPNWGPNTRTLKLNLRQGGDHTISQAGTTAPAVVSTITSVPTGASMTVSGAGCIPGTYTTPAQLTWNANTNCSVFFNSPQNIGGSSYTFYSATVNGGASVSSNPMTVNSGTAPPTIQANFQAPCTYALSASGQSFTSAGGLGSITVTTAPTCDWAPVSNANWITILPSGSRGTGTVNFAVASSSGSARSGTITVGGQQFTVSQQAFSCTYTITPASGAYGAEGGDTRVVVNAPTGCPWTASSNAAWLTVVSSPSGTGNGAVTVRAAFNPATSRSGSVTIAGQVFSATQNALGQTACGAIDVSSLVTVNRSGMTWIPPSQFSQTFGVRNNSSSIIPGPVYLVLVGEPTHRGSPYDSFLMGPQLTTTCFTPLGDYLLLMSGDLQPGQSTLPAPYLWYRETFGSINFSTRVLSGRPSH